MSRAGRYREVDALRGFALFGVLLVNLYGFGADSLAWDGTPDRVFWQIKHVFFESKFWGLFSLLFGLSFWLQNRNGTSNTRSVTQAPFSNPSRAPDQKKPPFEGGARMRHPDTKCKPQMFAEHYVFCERCKIGELGRLIGDSNTLISQPNRCEHWAIIGGSKTLRAFATAEH